jgi:hypothetical protein
MNKLGGIEMGNIDEIDAMKQIDTLLSQFEDKETRNRILKWALDKFGVITEIEPKSVLSKKPKTPKKKISSKKTSISIDKDLNLKPKGKRSLADFVAEKKPNSNLEKITIFVYYLKHDLNIERINPSHVFTCFKDQNWRVPADLVNAMQFTASQKGWLDTSDMENVIITTIGENHVEHDLPRKTSG